MKVDDGGILTVYVVTGEFCFSRNGEVAWQEGIYRNRDSANRAARAAADDETEGRCLVDGKPYGANWECECEGTMHGPGCEADRSRWDASWTIQPMRLLD